MTVIFSFSSYFFTILYTVSWAIDRNLPHGIGDHVPVDPLHGVVVKAILSEEIHLARESPVPDAVTVGLMIIAGRLQFDKPHLGLAHSLYNPAPDYHAARGKIQAVGRGQRVTLCPHERYLDIYGIIGFVTDGHTYQ